MDRGRKKAFSCAFLQIYIEMEVSTRQRWWYLLQLVIAKQRKLGKLFPSFCTRCGRISIPFQIEQIQLPISCFLEKSQLWAALKRKHTTLSMVKLFQFKSKRKDCKICCATTKKRMAGTSLYNLLVRHSVIQKRYRFWFLLHRILLHFPIL